MEAYEMGLVSLADRHKNTTILFRGLRLAIYLREIHGQSLLIDSDIGKGKKRKNNLNMISIQASINYYYVKMKGK